MAACFSRPRRGPRSSPTLGAIRAGAGDLLRGDDGALIGAAEPDPRALAAERPVGTRIGSAAVGDAGPARVADAELGFDLPGGAVAGGSHAGPVGRAVVVRASRAGEAGAAVARLRGHLGALL